MKKIASLTNEGEDRYRQRNDWRGTSEMSETRERAHPSNHLSFSFVFHFLFFIVSFLSFFFVSFLFFHCHPLSSSVG